MNIRLFNAKYTVRRFAEPKNVRGYSVSSFSDMQVEIDVSPSGNDSMNTQPEGENKTSALDGWGVPELHVSDVTTGIRGDMLWYDNDWYECVSCRKWNHTLLSHYNYHFVMVPRTEAMKSSLEPPDTDTEGGGTE